jgi:hypothetical protein
MILETAAAGTLGRILGGLIDTTTNSFVGKYKRLREVREAFEQEHPNVPHSVRVAVDDIQTFLGSWRGELTTRIAAFLMDIRDSGLAARICEAELCGFDAPGIKLVFKTLYDKHGLSSELGLNCDDTYQKLARMLAVSVAAQASSDPNWFVRVSYGRLRRAIERFDQHLVEIFSGTKNSEYFELKQCDPVLMRNLSREIAHGLAHDVERIWILGPDGRNRNVHLDEIYVSLPNLELEDVTGSRKIGSFAVPDELLDLTKLVILGAPGSGKSTLAQRLCLDFLKACGDGDGPLAVRIIIREFEAARISSPSLSLVDYIVSKACQHTSLARAEVLQVTRYLLTFGQLILILDGLDEVLDVGPRKAFVDLIHDLLAVHPLCKCIVTSRIVGYNRAPLKEFSTTQIKPLDLTDVERFVQRLWLVLRSGETSSPSEVAADFVEKARHASDLISNPLLLTLMVWLYRELAGRIPSNRAKIYEECAIVLYKRWDDERRIMPDIPRDFELFHLMMDLANVIYTDRELSAGVGRPWLKDFIRRFFTDYYNLDRERRAEVAAEKVCAYLTDRAWVMTETGLGVFNFTHRTFLEYFFAMKIDDEYNSASSVIQSFTLKIIEGQWYVPLHLVLQKKVGFRKRVAEEVADSLMQLLQTNGDAGGIEPSSFTFAALEYLTGAEDKLQALATAAARQRLKIAVKGRQLVDGGISEWVRPLLQFEFPNREIVIRGYVNCILDVVRDSESDELGYLADAFQFSQFWIEEWGDASIAGPWQMLWREVGPRLLTSISEILSEKTYSAFEAKACFDISGCPTLIRDEMMHASGSNIWEPIAFGTYTRLNWMCVDLVRMAEAILHSRDWPRAAQYVSLAHRLSEGRSGAEKAQGVHAQTIVIPHLKTVAHVTGGLLDVWNTDQSNPAVWFLISGISRVLTLMGMGRRDDDEYGDLWRKLSSVAKKHDNNSFKRWGADKALTFKSVN